MSKKLIFLVILAIILGSIVLFTAKVALADMPRPMCDHYTWQATPEPDGEPVHYYKVCGSYSAW